MAKVYAPNKNYNGVSATVTFVDGVGETTNEDLLAWFREKGYIVAEEKKDSKRSRGRSTKAEAEVEAEAEAEAENG